MTRQALMENVYLNYIPSEKFKTGFLSAQLVMPLERESAALNALLVNVLSRGTVRCPDMAAISARLDALYGARLEPTVRKKGENQVFGLWPFSIDERVPAGGGTAAGASDGSVGEHALQPRYQKRAAERGLRGQ